MPSTTSLSLPRSYLGRLTTHGVAPKDAFLKEDTGAQPHVCQWTLRSQVVEKVTGELVLPQRSNSCTQCMSPLWLLLPPPHGPHALWAAIVQSLETALPLSSLSLPSSRGPLPMEKELGSLADSMHWM